MPTKARNPIDVHVGRKLKLRRSLVGMSQTELGKGLGLTFQQVQKYESGSNRIGASRLFEIAKILGVEVQYFFHDLQDTELSQEAPIEPPAVDQAIDAFAASADGVKLLRSFVGISNGAVRRNLINLVCSLNEAEQD